MMIGLFPSTSVLTIRTMYLKFFVIHLGLLRLLFFLRFCLLALSFFSPLALSFLRVIASFAVLLRLPRPRYFLRVNQS